MSDKNNRNKENYEKINENYNKDGGSWGQNGTTTEERAINSYSKDKK